MTTQTQRDELRRLMIEAKLPWHDAYEHERHTVPVFDPRDVVDNDCHPRLSVNSMTLDFVLLASQLLRPLLDEADELERLKAMMAAIVPMVKSVPCAKDTKAAIGRAIDREMRFYKISMPTEPGVYWMRFPDHENALIVFVSRLDNGQLCGHCVVRIGDVGQSLSAFHGQWYNRIPEPPQPENTP